MAQQLTSMGEQVGLVILLETYNPSLVSRRMARRLSPLHKLQNLWFHAANLASLAGKDRRKFLTEKWHTEQARLRIRLQAFIPFSARLGQQEAHANYPHLKIKQSNDQANFGYVPQSYKGRVAVIRPKGHFAGEADPSLGWSEYIQGLEIHDLPTYPRGMLVEPFCPKLAETLNLCLEKL
jgi:thioesterase domain-containing protein